MKFRNPFLVLSQFETALGVVWSIDKFSKQKITTLDYKRDISSFSRFTESINIPNPTKKKTDFLDLLIKECEKTPNLKPALFITADDFLNVISENRQLLSKYFLFNISSISKLNIIQDKYKLFKFSKANNIPVPGTYKITNKQELDSAVKNISNYPMFIKGLDVNLWRQNVNGTQKGFLVNNKKELIQRSQIILEKKVPFIAQKIIKGPDTNHYKVCVYYSRKGKQLLNFTLRKIRQNPIHFGVGAVVESIKYPELAEIGTKLFDTLNYRGVGSAEFKLDQKDGKLKLIEINPRYWQQNYLAAVCGMNFPLMDYLEITDQNPKPITEFKAGIKWINRYMDLDSFLKYWREGALTYSEWRKSLKGKKTYSDFQWYDPLPFLFELKKGKKLLNIPRYLYKRIKK